MSTGAWRLRWSPALSQASAATIYSTRSLKPGDKGRLRRFFSPNSWTWSSGNVWTYTGIYNPTGAYTGAADDFEVSFVGGVRSIASAVGLDGTSGWTASLAGPSVTFEGPIEQGRNLRLQRQALRTPPLDPGLTGTWSASVWEASTWAMMLAGFAGLGFWVSAAERPVRAIA